MNNIEVVVDIDGVLADFEGFFCDMFGKNHRELVGLEKRYPEKKAAITRFVQNRETYRFLYTIPLGVEIVQWLRSQDVIIHIVSSRPFGTYDITKNWLNHFHIPYTSLTVKFDKVSHIKSLFPALIVDDIIDVAEECHKVNIPAVLVKQPWNETPFFPRVENIDQFILSFERIMDARPAHQWR